MKRRDSDGLEKRKKSIPGNQKPPVIKKTTVSLNTDAEPVLPEPSPAPLPKAGPGRGRGKGPGAGGAGAAH